MTVYEVISYSVVCEEDDCGWYYDGLSFRATAEEFLEEHMEDVH